MSAIRGEPPFSTTSIVKAALGLLLSVATYLMANVLGDIRDQQRASVAVQQGMADRLARMETLMSVSTGRDDELTRRIESGRADLGALGERVRALEERSRER